MLAAAFHVSYWDRLGWPDRFASTEFTARQAELKALLYAKFGRSINLEDADEPAA